MCAHLYHLTLTLAEYIHTKATKSYACTAKVPAVNYFFFLFSLNDIEKKIRSNIPNAQLCFI